MDKRNIRANRVKLIAIAMLFFIPVVAAWLLVLTDWRPAGMVNHGELISPAVPIVTDGLRPVTEQSDQVDFRGQWTILMATDGRCGEPCLELLDTTGRLHVALNRNMDRVQRVLVQPVGTSQFDVPPGVTLMHAQPAWLTEHTRQGAMVELVDPRGFRMMRYALPLDGHGLLKDLKRLLRVSKREYEQMAEEEK